MRRIAHVSDLHFGRHDPAVVTALLADLAAASPHLVAVSGDLTQRAKREEFAQARAFLDQITAPILVVPGNHDVPLYDIGRRLFRPLARFRRYISADRQPFFGDSEIAVVGLDSSRALTISGGRLNADQLRGLTAVLLTVPADRTRIVVTHHPLMAPPDHPDLALVGRVEAAIAAFDAASVDLVLAGHFHDSLRADLLERHQTLTRSILVAHAGTATSTRTRDELNAYNIIEIDGARITMRVRLWAGAGFSELEPVVYLRRGRRWVQAD